MIEVAMELEELAGRPAQFAAPYGVRGFADGDAEVWRALQQSTGVYPVLDPDLFEREFGSAAGGRQFFVMRGSEAVATGTAWHGGPLRSPQWGRLHWIAVRPDCQRRGLGLNLCRHLLTTLQGFGSRGAYLTTGSENQPAIALYRKLGFQPWIRSRDEAVFWNSGVPDREAHGHKNGQASRSRGEDET
jgi:ribosomal protein S18 acetylase RimI-like enzyme